MACDTPVDTDSSLPINEGGRRSADDPFFAEGDAVCHAYNRIGVFDIDEEELCHEIFPTFSCNIPGCSMNFDSVFEFDIHFNSVHRYKCSQCKKYLASPHLLDLHLMESHDSFFLAQAERKPMYSCYIEVCPVKSANPQERRHHCMADHDFPSHFHFEGTRKHSSHQSKHQSRTKDEEAMETNQTTQHACVKNKKSKKKSTDRAELMSDSEMAVDGDVKTSGRGRGRSRTNFVPFSLGRGGNRGRRGMNWHQLPSSSGRSKPASTFESSLVDDLRASLPEPEPMTFDVSANVLDP